MARQYLALSIGQDRVDEAELLDAVRNLADLIRRMGAGVAGGGAELRGGAVFHLQVVQQTHWALSGRILGIGNRVTLGDIHYGALLNKGVRVISASNDGPGCVTNPTEPLGEIATHRGR